MVMFGGTPATTSVAPYFDDELVGGGGGSGSGGGGAGVARGVGDWETGKMEGGKSREAESEDEAASAAAAFLISSSVLLPPLLSSSLFSSCLLRRFPSLSRAVTDDCDAAGDGATERWSRGI